MNKIREYKLPKSRIKMILRIDYAMTIFNLLSEFNKNNRNPKGIGTLIEDLLIQSPLFKEELDRINHQTVFNL